MYVNCSIYQWASWLHTTEPLISTKSKCCLSLSPFLFFSITGFWLCDIYSITSPSHPSPIFPGCYALALYPGQVYLSLFHARHLWVHTHQPHAHWLGRNRISSTCLKEVLLQFIFHEEKSFHVFARSSKTTTTLSNIFFFMFTAYILNTEHLNTQLHQWARIKLLNFLCHC